MIYLFQGDSVTDCGRDRGDPLSLGEGYVKKIAAFLRENYPGTDSGHKLIAEAWAALYAKALV